MITKPLPCLFSVHPSRISQNRRLFRLEGTSGDDPVQHCAKAGSPRAGDSGTRPGGFGKSLERETPGPPCAACVACVNKNWRCGSAAEASIGCSCFLRDVMSVRSTKLCVKHSSASAPLLLPYPYLAPLGFSTFKQVNKTEITPSSVLARRELD